MLSKKLAQELNSQLNFELYSAYIYYAMAAALEAMNAPGAANWMKVQAQEELTHADKFFSFINERDGRVILEAVEKPQKEWKAIIDVFTTAYKHEQLVTGRINCLVELAMEEKDYAANQFLQWFVAEQIEEESSVKVVIDQLKLADKAPGAMFMIDRELGQRVFVPPTGASST